MSSLRLAVPVCLALIWAGLSQPVVVRTQSAASAAPATAAATTAHLTLGQQVRVKVDSFPDREFPGEVEQIARAAEFTPRNVQTVSDRVKQVFGVKVRLPGDNESLRAGMAADVYFPDTPKAE